MSASPANLPSDSHPPPTSPTARAAGRLRRLSQLRAYTQSHLAPHASSSSPSSSSSSSPRSYRNSLTRVVGLSSPLHSPTPQSLTAEGTTAAAPAARSSTRADQPSQTPPPESSPSTSSHDPHTQTPGNRTENMASAGGDGLVSTNGQGSVTSSQNPSDRQNGGVDTATRDSRSITPKPRQEATIRFFAYQDPHNSTRPSLPFAPMTRILPSENSVIRVGRYSERDGVPVSNPSEPSDAPIGFKSKVVSRKHCEFSFADGQWYIKDVGSSSGTFLNRMRLSQPNMESRLYAVRDGDIVQLGIDFRGGEEMIFRCVRIRLECNRSWQQRPNEFNKNTEALIKNLGKGDAADDFSGCRECSICLGSVLRPYQCLFMAACAHVWHYKCIRRLIPSADYPMFQCPNCRAWTDLSAEVDDTSELDDEGKTGEPSETTREAAPEAVPRNEETPPNNLSQEHPSEDADLAAMTENMQLQERGTPRQESQNPDGGIPTQDEPATSDDGRSANIPIPARLSPAGTPSGAFRQQRHSGNPAIAETFEDNPMTPRNDTGPLAFDGRAGRL